ncbi:MULTISPECIES: hypothetical protein [Streptomyces]|uniref:DUF7848 domain-containing protein n=1 Tax=Streptomyces TaxID=1883 RepID=UPI001114EE91|nr:MULTISPECIES: hypothetical protein [Streptomyces]
MIKTAEWTLSLDESPDVPRIVYRAACLECGMVSLPGSDESLSVEVWAIKHTGLNPSHRRFTLRTAQPWVVEPAPGNPYYDAEMDERHDRARNEAG